MCSHDGQSHQDYHAIKHNAAATNSGPRCAHDTCTQPASTTLHHATTDADLHVSSTTFRHGPHWQQQLVITPPPPMNQSTNQSISVDPISKSHGGHASHSPKITARALASRTSSQVANSAHGQLRPHSSVTLLLRLRCFFITSDQPPSRPISRLAGSTLPSQQRAALLVPLWPVLLLTADRAEPTQQRQQANTHTC
jgi:hypothetical protein